MKACVQDVWSCYGHGGRTMALCNPRDGEGEKCKEKPSQGVRSYLTVQQLIRRDEGEQTC